jgi:crotonobetainyl-CoA:carnitine CoA-transferase CaiB-like acyl-CoA transferase
MGSRIMKPSEPQPLPLAGLCVVEIGHSLAAPYASHILAQLGARVVKVEARGKGDYARGWGPPFTGDAATLFHAVNNGKESVRADFDDAQSLARVRAFVLAHADVVVQNLKAGALVRHGLDADTLSREKPDLIYCNIGAFGRTGPLADRPGYDPLIQAFSGMMSILGHAGDEPSRIPVSINDMGTGMWAVIGILAALAQRSRNPQGRPRVVDVSLLETSIAWMTVPLTDRLAGGPVPRRNGSGSPNIAPYQVFRCADGQVMIAAGNDVLFARLCQVLGMPELAADPRFATNGSRVSNLAALLQIIEPVIAVMDSRDCLSRLSAQSIPCGPLNSVDEVLSHPQVAALDILRHTPSGDVRTVALPIAFDGERPPLAGNGPRLGEHDALLDSIDINQRLE